MSVETPGWRDRLPFILAGILDVSALAYLAPLEFQTGIYLGLSWWLAWTISGVVDTLAALALLTGRLLWFGLGLAWASGVVGQVHAASEAARHDGVALDWMRVVTSIAVVTIIVAGMAGGRWLACLMHRQRAERAAELERTLTARADRERAEKDARAAAYRAHELEKTRVEEERTRATRWAELESARQAHEAEMERTRLAHEHEARMTELARTQTPEKAVRAPRTQASRARVRPAPKSPVRAPVQADDLALRRRVREQWARREASGRATPTKALARTLGVGDGAARAQVSRWRAEGQAAAQDDAHAAGGDR